MELKTLQIEIVMSEMIAERNKMILQLNEQSVNQQKEIEDLKTTNSDLKAKIEALTPKE